MSRWLSIGVISYMILGIIWWGLLLFQKNEQIYQLQLTNQSVIDKEEVSREYSRQKIMIVGEGIVLGISLLLGIYIINKSASSEIQNARRQNDFLLSVNHELKSPIASIKLALQTLSRSSIDEIQKIKILEGSLGEAKRLEDLVQNILLSANIDDKKFRLYKEQVQIQTYLSDIIRSYQPHNQIIDVQFESLPEDCSLELDKMNVEQAIRNILDNAIKYNHNSEPILFSCSLKEDVLKISVANKGNAIHANDREEIFKKFQRGSDPQTRALSGTGIGLYIASEVVKAHQGQLLYDHIEGRNIFEVQLPFV